MKVYIGPHPKGDKERKVRIRIDKYDVWSMNETLALIITPMLKMLKEQQHGSAFVENEDVPEELHGSGEWYDNDDGWAPRWNYVLNEMIYAFESKIEDREDQFWTTENTWDEVGLRAHLDRVQNGLRLFGKYYSGLWD